MKLNCRELFDPQSILHLPATLHDAYRAELLDRGLLESAIAGSLEKQIHGGLTQEETLKHFKYRFANSASRVVCILVDPVDAFASLSVEIFQSFSSHRIAVLDAPCGAGASLLTLLTVLDAARAQRLLPQLPLTINAHGADISPTALEIYASLGRQLAPLLAIHGINLEISTHLWDASQANQTSKLCDDWFGLNPDANEYFVLIGNLSGVGEAIAESFQRSFAHITERISNFASTVLWIEPIVTKSITKRIKAIFSLASWLTRSRDLADNAQCRYRWKQPIEDKVLDGGVTVHSYTRKGGDAN